MFTWVVDVLECSCKLYCSKISFSSCVLVYRNVVEFCTLYPAILLGLLVSFRNWFVHSFGFSPYKILSSVNKDGFTFFFQSVPLFLSLPGLGLPMHVD